MFFHFFFTSLFFWAINWDDIEWALYGKNYGADNVTKKNRSLFNSWRSGGALSGTSSNNHINILSDYPSYIQSTTAIRIMATSSGILKDCTHSTFNETIKSHNNVTFKLVKTGKWEIIIRFWFKILFMNFFSPEISFVLQLKWYTLTWLGSYHGLPTRGTHMHSIWKTLWNIKTKSNTRKEKLE